MITAVIACFPPRTATAMLSAACASLASRCSSRVLVEGEPDDSPRTHVQDRVEEQLALISDDLSPVAIPLLIQRAGREITPNQVRRPPATVALAGGVPAPPLGPRDQALLAHDRSDGLLAHHPAGLAQIVGDPRRAELAVVRREQLLDRFAQLSTARMPRRGVPIAPLVELGTPTACDTPSARHAVAYGT